MTDILPSFSQIAGDYDAVFCDLWGVVHNGREAFPEAVQALTDYRARGGKVVLVTNAPRPRADVATQLDRLNVPLDAWDTIATSGDSARIGLFTGAVGRKVWYIGEPRDTSFFDPIHILENPVEIELVDLDEAEGIVCCGPEDPLADPAIYRPQFLLARERGLRMLCANPDIVVDRGESREWCAGALAQLYTDMGGESLYFGKPHPPIYDLARRRLAELGNSIPDERILCIGDGIATDVKGAMGEDLDCLFITGGLAAAETGTERHPNALLLGSYLGRAGMDPLYSMGRLRS